LFCYCELNSEKMEHKRPSAWGLCWDSVPSVTQPFSFQCDILKECFEVLCCLLLAIRILLVVERSESSARNGIESIGYSSSQML
jgi:hypothetical protein